MAGFFHQKKLKNGMCVFFSRKTPENYWLLVEPTPSEKYYIVKLGSSSPSFGVNIKKLFETTT